MSDEEKKDEKQDPPVEQPAAGVPPATEKDVQAPQAADAGDGAPPLPTGAPAQDVQEPQQGADCHDAAQQTGAEGGVTSDSPDITSGTPGERDGVSSGGGQTEQKPVSAEGTDTPQAEASPETEDLMTVTDESEEEKELIARVMRSWDDAIGRGNIREPEDDPAGRDQAPDSATWPEYEDYEPGPTTALIRREGRIEVARVEWQGQHPTLTVVSDRYATPSMPSAVYSSVRLPNDVSEYQSARQVFDAVYEVLQNCSALSRQQCELLTFWCVASWFQDSLDFLPRVTISGPRFAADLLFTLLTYVCHKAIKLVDMSMAVLKEISMEDLRPTLLIYQVRASKTATQLLDASDYPGYIFTGAGELRQFCCAKILYVGEACKPKQTMSGLHIHLGRNAPVPARPYLSSAAIESLQNKLLSYRAFNCMRTEFLKIQAGELQPELDVIARRLGAVIINDSALQCRLIELLKAWSEDLRAERAGGTDATVLIAALNLSHSNQPLAYAREIAVGANQIRNERGEASKLSNEKVGHVLKKLGLHTQRDMKGSALVFDQATQLLVHELCFEYDVLPAAPECGYCHKLQTPESE